MTGSRPEARFPQMMTCEQAGRLLGIKPGVVADLVRSGELPAVHCGDSPTHWLHPHDVLAYATSLERRLKFAGIEGDDQLCIQHVIQLGSRRARGIADLMIKATGAGCPCTWGDPCLFEPHDKLIKLGESA